MTDGQFAVVPIEAIQDKRLTLEQMRVLIALFSFRNKVTDTVWPSRAKLVERTGMHPSNISAATTALVGHGWLLKAGAGGFSKSSRYTLCRPDEIVAESATSKVAERATVAESTTVAERATRKVAESARGVVAESARGKEETIELTIEETIPQSATPPALALVTDVVAKPVKSAVSSKPDAEETALQGACRETWAAYSSAYVERYGIAPVRNQQVNAKVKAFVQRIGYAEAPGVARFYVERVSERFVVGKCHDVGLLLSGAEGYRTQWATGQAMTSTRAQQADKSQANYDAAAEAIALVRARRGVTNAE